jgi:hypothetical protein
MKGNSHLNVKRLRARVHRSGIVGSCVSTLMQKSVHNAGLCVTMIHKICSSYPTGSRVKRLPSHSNETKEFFFPTSALLQLRKFVTY